MAPMPKGDGFTLGGSQAYPAGTASLGNDYGSMVGWPLPPSLVPTLITWVHGGSDVAVEGSFDNWTTRQAMIRSGKDYAAIKLLLPGVYQYKFIVDGEWKYAPELPAMYDEMGNINNVLEVLEPPPEVTPGPDLAEFSGPESPTSSYAQPLPALEDFAKASPWLESMAPESITESQTPQEPPVMPPQLELTLLNVPRIEVDPALLPRPQHVVLNHVYSERGASGNAAGLAGGGAASPAVQVLGSTVRYRAKYITTVIYMPGAGHRQVAVN